MRGQTAAGSSSVWELVVFCIDGEDEEAARERARELGDEYATEYETATGEMLRWRFEAVQDIQLLDPFPPVHGSELFSCFLKEREARSLMEPIDE